MSWNTKICATHLKKFRFTFPQHIAVFAEFEKYPTRKFILESANGKKTYTLSYKVDKCGAWRSSGSGFQEFVQGGGLSVGDFWNFQLQFWTTDEVSCRFRNMTPRVEDEQSSDADEE
ncbi:hypothetical protein ACHQM5_023442 [Ranunculus cassubicifolius]